MAAQVGLVGLDVPQPVVQVAVVRLRSQQAQHARAHLPHDVRHGEGLVGWAEDRVSPVPAVLAVFTLFLERRRGVISSILSFQFSSARERAGGREGKIRTGGQSR